MSNSEIVSIGLQFITLVFFSVFAAALVNLANKLHKSIPPEALPYLRPTVDTAVNTGVAAVDKAVSDTPSTVDDELWASVRPKVLELVKSIFEGEPVPPTVGPDGNP